MEYEKRCEWCGKVFKARKMTTKYCSHRCNGFAYKQKLKEQKKKHFEEETSSNLPKVGIIVDKPFLSPNEVAVLLGVSRASVYRMLANGEIKALQFKRKCIIRRIDLEKLFDAAAPYKRRSYGRQETRQYYTMTEITSKYNISRKAAKGRLERLGIQPIYEGRNTFFNKNAVDIGFAELLDDVNLENYYTIPQIMEKYAMSKAAVLAFVMRHNIPRVKRLRKVFYAKSHIDALKGTGDPLDPEYYTYNEIMKKFNLTKDQVSHYINTYHVVKFKRGRYTMISRLDFDKLIQLRKDGTLKRIKESDEVDEGPLVVESSIPEGYLTAEQIAEKYNLTMHYARNLARINRIPSIRIKQFNYYEQKAVEYLFEKYKEPEGVSAWLTRAQVESIYQMTTYGVRAFVHRHKIPCKNLHGETLYSKSHIDDVKEFRFAESDQYLSVEQIIEKYGITRHAVYNYTRYYNVKKVKKGQFTFFLKSDIAKVMKEKKQ